MNTRNTTVKIILLAGITLSLIGCGHKHQWVDATCTLPKTCSECGKTEGEPLGHDWADATCTEPKTCKVCGATEGEPLGHHWLAATCYDPLICKVCGVKKGEALGHKWKDATCTTPKKCRRCALTEGEPLGHNIEEWEITAEATCTENGTREGTCSVCGETITETIEATGHVPSEEWEIIEEATFSTSGKRVKTCTVCGEEVESESFEMTDEEKDDYRPSIEGDHFDCTVDDFIECFKYKNRGSYTITKITSDDESQSYILQARSKLKCIIVCTKTDEGKLKAILVQSDEDETSAIAVGLLMASTIDDYFDSNDRETTNEVATKLFLGKNVEHDGLVLGMITLNDGSKGLVIAPN